MDLFEATPVLHSESLVLRPLTLADSPAMHAMYSDAEAMKYWSSTPVKDHAETEKLVREDIAWVDAGRAIFWAVEHKETRETIGKCVLFNYHAANRRAEVGYILNRRYWRRGLMFEAMNAIISFATRELELHRLEADTDPDNAGSIALLRKLGFRQEGVFRERWLVAGKWVDSLMFGLLAQDWTSGD